MKSNSLGIFVILHLGIGVTQGFRPAFRSRSDLLPKTMVTCPFQTSLYSNTDETGQTDESGTTGSKKKKITKKPSKEELMKAVGEKMRNEKGSSDPTTDANLLDRLNPFRAGQNLRKTIDEALSSINMPEERKSMYYLDDRLNEGQKFTARNPSLERLEQEDFVPEVLVVGATGEVGRLVVRRLLLDGRFRVRVLVRDLYTDTLNLLGTGVTYCQGDLSNTDSLEYALTDVDKICFLAGPPREDEDQFRQKFEDYMKETLQNREAEVSSLRQKLDDGGGVESDAEWEQLEAVLEVRARLAEQVDSIGLQNLVRAYQNVRHADYGTSQAAKRSLFKFQDRPDDFNLFAIDESDAAEEEMVARGTISGSNYDSISYEEVQEDEYEHTYGEDEYSTTTRTAVELRNDASVQTQCQWIRNQFEHGVFVGKVPKSRGTGIEGGEAAIVSTRLRSRDDPDNGIDLSAGFAGFILRLCSDGGTYEAFVRTRSYYEDGIEYVSEFTTATKLPAGKNKSANKFTTVRLPFESFKPVIRKTMGDADMGAVPPFRGQDVRNIGFRYRSASNSNKLEAESAWSSFYLALCYVKLYRSQPEPEFIYLSDARIPPVVTSNMIRHDARQLLLSSNADDITEGGSVLLFDESTLDTVTKKRGHSVEETYYKYRGEEIIKQSGLSYTILRISGYNESPSSEVSTIDLTSTPIPQDDDGVRAVSRADVAQVVSAALLDPNALNKSVYMSKKKKQTASGPEEEDISVKFASLARD